MSGRQALRSGPTVTASSATVDSYRHFADETRTQETVRKRHRRGWDCVTPNWAFYVQNLLRTRANLAQFTEYPSRNAQLPLFPSSGSTQGMLSNSLFSSVPFTPDECNCWVFFFFQFKHSKPTRLTFPGAHSVPSSGGPFFVLQKYGLSGWLHHNCLHGSKVRN